LTKNKRLPLLILSAEVEKGNNSFRHCPLKLP